MLLANCNRKEHLRHRAVSLRQHGFLVYISDSEGAMDSRRTFSVYSMLMHMFSWWISALQSEHALERTLCVVLRTISPRKSSVLRYPRNCYTLYLSWQRTCQFCQLSTDGDGASHFVCWHYVRQVTMKSDSTGQRRVRKVFIKLRKHLTSNFDRKVLNWFAYTLLTSTRLQKHFRLWFFKVISLSINDCWMSILERDINRILVIRLLVSSLVNGKMVNGSQYYRALESVSIASALSRPTTLTVYPCQIRVHLRWQSKLRLPTARKKEWWPATEDSLPQAVTCQLWYTLR